MKIIIKGKYSDMKQFFMSELDKSDYNSIQELQLDLYDENTGEPINSEVEEMDNCIYKKWNPERFVELFNKLWKNSDRWAEISY